MKNFCFALCIAMFVLVNRDFGSEAGMPQLNPEFWAAQIFWLLLTFTSLYLIIWKIFLPKITYNIETRKSKVVNDLHQAQKLKEEAEKKLVEYNKIIEDTKKEAKKIIEDERKKLDENIDNKKQKFNDEIDKELAVIEREVKNLKKTSILNINKIATETSTDIVKQIIDAQVNQSNVAATVNDVVKRKIEKYI